MKNLIPVFIAAVMVGCGTVHEQRLTSPATFTAEMGPEHVVSGDPARESNGHGRATMILSGNTLRVHGAFSDLTSNLRDADQTPGNPGVFIHMGDRQVEGSELYGLPVELNRDERGGTFSGEFELSTEEVSRLRDGRLHLAVHTERYPEGEIRGQIQPEPSPPGSTR